MKEKEKVFNLDQRAVDLFFSPVRHKADVIILLMNAIKYMLVNFQISDENSKGKMSLNVSKMSRLSFFTDQKYFSICFPFFVDVSDVSLIDFYTKDDISVDSKLTSEILSVINDSDIFNRQDVFDFIEPIDQVEPPSMGLWNVLKELMMFEDGYIRYDFDELRENPKYHPKYHLDIFYSSSSSFKFGLKEKPSPSDFLNMMDINMPCLYLTQNM